jgi:hypothetical protein
MTKEFDQLLVQDLPALNESLKAKDAQPIEPLPAKVGANDSTHGSGGVVGGSASLPADFQISW